MNAVIVEDGIGLMFTKVVDEMALGLTDEDEEVAEVADREYWLDRGTDSTVEMADKVLQIIHEFDGDIELKYNKFYIGLAKDGIPNNFVKFRPKKQWMNLEIRLDERQALNEEMESKGLESEYLTRWRKYRLRLRHGDIEKHAEILSKLVRLASERSEA